MLSSTKAIKNYGLIDGLSPEVTVYPADYEITDVADVTVYYTDPVQNIESDIRTHQNLNGGAGVDYTISLITETGFTVTLDEGIEGGILSIRREVKSTQEMHYREGNDFPAASHERALDKLTMISQQFDEKLNRTLRLKLSDESVDMEMPLMSELKNGIMGFDEDGHPTVRPGFIPRAYDFTYEYLVDDIIQHNGIFYISKTGTEGNENINHEPGSTVPDNYWRNLNFDGIQYQSKIVFQEGEIVEQDGNLFRSVIDNNQNAPSLTDSTYWRQLPLDNKWCQTALYLVNSIVEYNGNLFKCYLQNDNHPPTRVYPDLYWEEVPVTLNYHQTTNYMTGDTVEYDGYLYRSTIDNNKGSIPGIGNSDWSVVVISLDWYTGIVYAVDTLVSYGGFTFKSLQGSNAGNIPTLAGDDAWWVIIPAGINWYANAIFSENDHVEYQGYMFRSLIVGDNRNNTPTVPDGDANWERVFTKGDPGEINVWSSTGDYGLDQLVTYDGLFYISLQSNNVDKQPDTETSWWAVWPNTEQLPFADIDENYDATTVEAALSEVKVIADANETVEAALSEVRVIADANETHAGSDGKNHSDVVLNNTHRGSTGVDHGYINQDVKTTASPTFAGLSLKQATNADRNIEFASDADILWDESEDTFLINKKLNVQGLYVQIFGRSTDTIRASKSSYNHSSQSYERAARWVSPIKGNIWLKLSYSVEDSSVNGDIELFVDSIKVNSKYNFNNTSSLTLEDSYSVEIGDVVEIKSKVDFSMGGYNVLVEAIQLRYDFEGALPFAILEETMT